MDLCVRKNKKALVLNPVLASEIFKHSFHFIHPFKLKFERIQEYTPYIVYTKICSNINKGPFSNRLQISLDFPGSHEVRGSIPLSSTK